MPAQITSYAGLKAGMLAWLARSGDTLLEGRFDDFLQGCERRMYYGHATEEPGDALRSDPLRILEMEPSIRRSCSGRVAQPAGFVELISVLLNSPEALLEIVSQRTLDAYGAQSLGGTRQIAMSGTNFRFQDDAAGATATLRYYRKLATPSGATANAILTELS